LHNKKYDICIEEIVLAINLATAAIFRSKISLSFTVFRLSRKSAINYNEPAINVKKIGLEVYATVRPEKSQTIS